MIKTIISNNCFGGCISNDYHMEFCSPTINLQILPEEFPKFCKNLTYYMKVELMECKAMSLRHEKMCEHMFGYVPTEYRQFAEWLRELKALREDEEVQEVFKNCNTCKYESLPPDIYPCDRCNHRYINQYVYDDKREVNADEK